MLRGTYGGQRTTCVNQFPPPIMWAPGIQLRAYALAH